MFLFRNIFGLEAPPDKVVERKSDVYASRHVHAREEGLVLYLPNNNAKEKTDMQYEIVLHRPLHEGGSNTISLCRVATLEEAENKFTVFKDKLPAYVDINKEMCNVTGLQKICDILNEHPSWTLAHLAANLCSYDSFSNPKISSFINSTDADTGMSPLQVAIQTQNSRTVAAIVALNCSLDHRDHNLNTVFHYAAGTTKEIIDILAQNCSPNLMSEYNNNGYTPLHMACLSDKAECVKALLVAGADVNKAASKKQDEAVGPGYVGKFIQDNPNQLHQQDMKFGGSPLHWAMSRAVVETLLDMNCHIDMYNFEQKTALHVMVERNRLECAVALLSRGANPDLGDLNGDRPLHVAVRQGSIPIMQALIVFGADLNCLNNAGQTARHLMTKENEPKHLYTLHGVGAVRCTPEMENCTDGCRFDGTYDGVAPPEVLGPTNREILDQMLSVAGMEVATEKHKNGKFPHSGRLLCLDGGGIRGLVLVQMLLELEIVLQQPINHCFDWLAGTSTGGILSLAIATGKTMKECLCLYFRLKELTFVGYRPYKTEILESILQETFGADTYMSDIKYPKVMVTGVLADRKPVDLHLFRNYASASDLLNVPYTSPFEKPPPPDKQLIWEVGRATGAAPTYFRSFGRFLDGGLIANNPTLDALTEIHEHSLALKALNKGDEACPVSVVVSLGTGLIPTKATPEIDIYNPGFRLLESVKIVGGMNALGNLLVDQATQSEGRVVDRARAWCSSIGVPFFRFCPQMSAEVGMDEKSDGVLCNVLWETKSYMYQRRHIMRELADLLKKN